MFGCPVLMITNDEPDRWVQCLGVLFFPFIPHESEFGTLNISHWSAPADNRLQSLDIYVLPITNDEPDRWVQCLGVLFFLFYTVKYKMSSRSWCLGEPDSERPLTGQPSGSSPEPGRWGGSSRRHTSTTCSRWPNRQNSGHPTNRLDRQN